MTRAYGTTGPQAPLAPLEIERRSVGPTDVEIDIAFCGICHSDLHMARNEWSNTTYPIVPGHEIAGRVTKVGAQVSKFKAGDLAGVGCLVDSCRKCPSCKQGHEQFCSAIPSFSYNGLEQDKKTPTYGGYSKRIVVDEAFALRIAPGQALERVAPLLCAGITTYAPLKRHGVGKDTKVGVMGLGGLGHMAVKIAAAMGAEVTVLSRTDAKKADAKSLGAADFAATSGPRAGLLAGRFDFILDTVSADHDLNAPLSWLRTGGTMVLVGAPPKPLPVGAFSLVVGQKTLAGSLIGGLAETQEMLDFCASNKVLADVEVIAPAQINDAYERMLRGDVRYRFSIDLATL